MRSIRPRVTQLDALTMFCGFTERVLSRSDASDWVDARVVEAPPASSELQELAFLSRVTEALALFAVESAGPP